MMGLFSSIFDQLAPAVPQIGCVLPAPKERPKPPKRADVKDIFEIDPDRNEFGFHFATAQIQNAGSVSTLTGYDVDELKARGLWGTETTMRGKKNPRGVETNMHNARAKAAWHTGGNADAISAAVGLGMSWAEKRAAAFGAALEIETRG